MWNYDSGADNEGTRLFNYVPTLWKDNLEMPICGPATKHKPFIQKTGLCVMYKCWHLLWKIEMIIISTEKDYAMLKTSWQFLYMVKNCNRSNGMLWGSIWLKDWTPASLLQFHNFFPWLLHFPFSAQKTQHTCPPTVCSEWQVWILWSTECRELICSYKIL